MANIILRKVKEKDLESIGRCFAKKTIPVICAFPGESNPTQAIKDYLSRDMETEITLAIVEKNSDSFLGIVEGILVDDVLLISYFVDVKYQGNGVCTQALGLFINYIKRNNPHVKRLKALINNLNLASLKVVKKNNFKLSSINEFVQSWVYDL